MSIGSVVSVGSAGFLGFRGGCSSCVGEEPKTVDDSSATTREVSAPLNKTAQKELSKEEQEQVQELKKRDQEVRAHEAAHMGAGGGVVRGGATYTFQTGPDGQRYAVGGEVGIDASPVKDNPEATIRKMQQVRSAALAPANPSGQDRAVAAAASALEASARAQLTSEKKEKAAGDEQPSVAPSGKKSTGYDSSGAAEHTGTNQSVSTFELLA